MPVDKLPFFLDSEWNLDFGLPVQPLAADAAGIRVDDDMSIGTQECASPAAAGEPDPGNDLVGVSSVLHWYG